MLEFLDPFLKTLQTDSGFWNPILWGFAFVIIFLIAYILRGFGKQGYKEKTEQTKAFLSGNPEYTKEQMHIKGSNLYWGFMEVMKFAYNKLNKMHNGNTSDYILWFVIIMGIFFIVLGVL